MESEQKKLDRLRKEIRSGQRYMALTDIAAMCATHWRAAFTGGYDVVFSSGEEFTVTFDPGSGATGVVCAAINYSTLERLFVPEEDRDHPKYDSYSIVILMADIGDNCELVSGK